MKRFVAVMLLAVMVFSFSACGRKDTAKDDGIYTVNWYMQKPVSDMSHQKSVEAEVNKILEERVGARIKFNFLDAAQWENRVNVMIASNADFDILFAGGKFHEYARKNAFLDITDLLDKYGSDIKAKTDDFAWDAVKREGKIYGIPGQTFYVPYMSFAIKKDLAEKYNLDYKNLKTLDDIEPFLEKIKKNEPNMYPIIATAGDGFPRPKSDRYVTIMEDVVYYDTDTDKFVPYTDNVDEFDTFRKINEFYKKGYIAKDAASKTELTGEIKSGKYAVFSGRMDATKTTNLYGFECVESDPTFGIVSTDNVLNAASGISRNCKNPEKVIKVLNEIWKDPYLSNTLAYGLEGQDYVVDKEGDDLTKHITPNSGNDVKWSVWHNWIGPLWDQWDSPWNSRESLEYRQQLNKEAKISPVLGFVFDQKNIKNELAQISSIAAEAEPILKTGSMSDFDKFVSDLKKKHNDAGMQKVLKEIEKQYKEWEKTNK